MAMESMSTLNRDSAEMMLKYKCRGATDITGFGILGHAENLAAAQFSDVDLILEKLPVINKMEAKVDGMHDFGVMSGRSAETSGGILCIVPPEYADDFVSESLSRFGQTVWKVGKVVEGSKKAVITEDVQPISINEAFVSQV